MYRAVLAMALGVCAAACSAQEPAAKKDQASETQGASAQEKYRAIINEYSKAQQDYFNSYRQAKTDEERRAATSKYPRPEEYAERLMEMAKEHPDDPAAVDALSWIVQNVRAESPKAKPVFEEAVDLLSNKYIEHESIVAFVRSPSLAYSSSAAVEDLLRAAIEKSPHQDVQGHARFTLAQHLANRLESANYYRNAAGGDAARLKAMVGEETFERLQNLDEKKVAHEIETLCETVVEKHGDLQSYRGTLKEAAENKLFEIRNLAIGKESPDIEGEDIDGSPFKLSDYRGKVVVIDFWGDW